MSEPKIPKGYKKTEVGVIPEEWDYLEIQSIALFGRGRVISHKEISRANSPLYPVYSSQTSDEGIMGYLDTYEFDGEFITWTTDGANAGTFFYRNGKFNCTNVCGTIKVIKGNARFLSRELSIFADRYVSRNLGNPKLMNDIAKTILIPFPPLHEQRAIAEALSDVDSLLSSLDKLIEKKRAIKRGAMQELLTGRKRLPGFSGKWQKKKLGELGYTYGGLTGKNKNDFGSGYSKYITFMGVLNNSVIDSLCFSSVKVGSTEVQNEVRMGDLFLNGSSETPEEVGMCSVLLSEVQNTFLNSFCFGFRLLEDIHIDLRYFVFYMRSQEGRNLIHSLAQGATRYNLSKSEFLKLSIPLPPLPEQTAIATILSDMDADIEALERRRDKTKAIKQGMMQELLTGRIRLV